MQLLVAVDGTPDSDRALDHGLTLARAAGAELVLVHAVQPAVDEETAPEPVSGPAEVGDRLVMESTAEAEERPEYAGVRFTRWRMRKPLRG